MTGPVLALDLGLRRTGAAVGDLQLGIARPLETIRSRDDESRLQAVARLVAEWQPVLLVVGMPVAEDGGEHSLAAEVRRFAAALVERFGVPVEFADERFSSSEASLVLAQAGIRGIRQKALLDSYAACEILQAYFGAHGAVA